jgi:hypothetical protein
LWSHKSAAGEHRIRSAWFDFQEGEDCVLGRRQSNLSQSGIQAGAKRLLSLFQRKADRGVRVAHPRSVFLT